MTWRDKIAKASYPGRSPETADFAILAIVDPIWIVTTPSGMEIFESQGHGSLCWTPGELRKMSLNYALGLLMYSCKLVL